MIYTESRKLNLIASLIKESNDDVLMRVEGILNSAMSAKSSARFTNFSNTLTEQELTEFEKNIEEGCEQINENDWK